MIGLGEIGGQYADILKKDVKGNWVKAGDVVKVSDGYAKSLNSRWLQLKLLLQISQHENKAPTLEGKITR